MYITITMYVSVAAFLGIDSMLSDAFLYVSLPTSVLYSVIVFIQ